MSGRPGRSVVVRASLLIYVPLALLALAWLCIRHGVPGGIDRVIGSNVVRDVVLGLGVGLMLVGLTRLASAVFAQVRRAESVLAETVGSLSMAECVVLAIVSGLGEELLFRGALQPALGLVLTSLVFGAAHVPLRRELIAWPFFAAAVGLLLGWMASQTGALMAPIVAHVTVNAVNLRFITPRPA